VLINVLHAVELRFAPRNRSAPISRTLLCFWTQFFPSDTPGNKVKAYLAVRLLEAGVSDEGQKEKRILAHAALLRFSIDFSMFLAQNLISIRIQRAFEFAKNFFDCSFVIT
jgi:hypothetical protein